MQERVLTLAELERQPLADVFRSVASGETTLTVELPDGTRVMIAAKPLLKPMHVLKGHIPKGWKEAVYAQG